MPLIISHRGNLDGSCPATENHPQQIEQASEEGFEVEYDIWHNHRAGTWSLGHDKPQYEVKFDFLSKHFAWIHAKNHEVLFCLQGTSLNYFWHESDKFTLTSDGFFWTYPNNPICENSVLMLWGKPAKGYIKNLDPSPFAICTDYPRLVKEYLV